MNHDPRIDAYIATRQPFAQPILKRIREMVHHSLPDVEEGIKWGIPAFMLKGKNVAGMAGFKAHVALMLSLEDTAGGGMGSYGKLKSLDELPSEKELTSRLHHARDLLTQNKALRKVPARPPKPKIAVPRDFATALREAPKAKAAFDGFTDAQRRDYLEWIVEAKREETRTKRIATTLEWLAEGKRRNWKYER